MDWWWLSLCCLIAAVFVNAVIKRFWLALPLACVAGPLSFLLLGRLFGQAPDALDGLVVFFGQLVALPAAVIVGAGFSAWRA